MCTKVPDGLEGQVVTAHRLNADSAAASEPGPDPKLAARGVLLVLLLLSTPGLQLEVFAGLA